MSISPFHGGLVFRDELIDSSYPSHIEHARTRIQEASKQAVAVSGKTGDLNARNLNEFFNPSLSTLPLQERYDLCMAIGEEVIDSDELKAML
jgi:tyrosyl-tRNA synthetase